MKLERQVAFGVPDGSASPPLVAKRFDAPERALAFDHGRLEVISVGGQLIGKGRYAPGRRWSQVASGAHQARRAVELTGVVGVLLSGRAKAKTADAGELDLMPGDFFSLSGNHDVWVVGFRPCEILYLGGTEALGAFL